MPLLFVGDFLCDFDECPQDLALLGQYFHDHDFHLVLNLEGPMQGQVSDPDGVVILRQSDSIAAILGTINAAAADLANNHLLDWGAPGLYRLDGELARHGVVRFGAGADLESAGALRFVNDSGRRVGLLGFGWEMEGCVSASRARPGVAPLDERLVLRTVERARPLVDLLAVCFHWGYEYELLPLPIHRLLARRCVSAGADLVIGHHPHVIQATETFLGKRIFYSLGNFYFGSRREHFRTLNPVSAQHSQSGLGVLLCWTPTPTATPLFFKYADGRTTLDPVGVPLEDLSSVPLAEYDSLFDSRRLTRWKPSLHCGRLSAPRNEAALLRFKAGAGARTLLRRAGLYAPLRRLREMVSRA